MTTPGGLNIDFDIDAFRKDALLKGLDDIALTLQHEDKISAFEKRQRDDVDWLYN